MTTPYISESTPKSISAILILKFESFYVSEKIYFQDVYSLGNYLIKTYLRGQVLIRCGGRLMYNQNEMTTLSMDTDPRIEKIQIEMLRGVSSERKLRMVSQMNQTVRVFMLAGLKDRNPNIQPETLRRLLAELLFGEELGRKVCEYHA